MSLVSGIFLGGYAIYSENSLLIQHTDKRLVDIVESKVELIESFLKAKKGRAIDFSSDGFIKNSLVKLNGVPGSIQVMEDLSNHLIVNKLPLEKDFYEVMVLDVNGKVVGTTNPEETFGTDFSDNHMFLEGKEQPYLMEVFYDEEFRHKGIALSAPVSVDDKVLGVVVIKLLPESFYKIASGRTTLGETGEIYIVNRDKFLITPSRFLRGENKGILTQIVDTKGVEDCLEMIDKRTKEHIVHEPIISYLDYRGEKILGSHQHIMETEWCVLAEIDESEALGIPKNNFLKSVLITLITISISSTLLGFFVGRRLDAEFEKRGGPVEKDKK